jgi:hypothetical protein
MGRKRRMSEIEQDLRTTSENIEADATRLKAVEAEKQSLRAGSPRLLKLAKEAEALGEEIAAKTTAELNLAKDATGAT